MTAEKKAAAAAPVGNTLRVDPKQGEDSKAQTARIALRPSVRAAVTTKLFYKQFGDLDLTALVDELAAQSGLASNGDLHRAEAMLMSQAHTLEALFHELARRAACNMGEYLSAAETFMRLALKAQAQCCRTLETLGAIKNPAPVTFVKQANVAHGPQQVNNAPQPTESSRARESENQPNKLLEQQGDEWLDSKATRTTAEANSTVAAVGEVYGTQNAGR